MNVQFYPYGATTQHVALDGRVIGIVDDIGDGRWRAIHTLSETSKAHMSLSDAGAWLALVDGAVTDPWGLL